MNTVDHFRDAVSIINFSLWGNLYFVNADKPIFFVLLVFVKFTCLGEKFVKILVDSLSL